MNGEDDVLEGGRVWGGGRESERRQSSRPKEKTGPWPTSEMQDEDSLPPVFPDDRVYRAYDIISRARRLHIVRAARMARRPSYHYLVDIIEDVFHQSTFALIYPSMIVKVTGRNLTEIVHAINAGNCGRIREYHAKFYDPPPPDAPFIQEITITAADGEEPTK